MYAIGKTSKGIVLICRDCGHFERINRFDFHKGSQRTQAASAMQTHSVVMHNAPLPRPVPKIAAIGVR